MAAGEYSLINNYLPLTINPKLAAVPTDFWALDPVSLTFGSIGIYTQAPHPDTNCVMLAANYMLSHEGPELPDPQAPAPVAFRRGPPIRRA